MNKNPFLFPRAGYFGLLLFLLASLSHPHHFARAQSDTPEQILMPMGGGYTDVYPGWSELLVTRARMGQVKILVLPTTYSSNADKISDGERQVNLRDADVRRYELEQSCQRNAPEGVICSAVVLPVFTRQDANEIELQEYFNANLTAVFILGGDQTVAMAALANTPVEQALDQAYRRGVIIGGTSAGGGMLSREMLAGYRQNYAANSALNFGAAEVWNSSEKHGLAFSLDGAVLDQHFYQRSRLGRLLNAISQPGSPGIGIGIDAYTGMRVTNGTRISDLYGLYTVTILDAETYHAAQGVRYNGDKYTLSIRNVLVHMLSPGSASYDLTTRTHSLAAWQPRQERQFDGLSLPLGAGSLWLGGELDSSLKEHPALTAFSQASGGPTANVLVVALGYSSERSANSAATKVSTALGIQTEVVIVDAASSPVEIPNGITGIVVIGRDQSRLSPVPLETIRQAWLAGTPLLMDDAAMVLAGSYYSAHSPTPSDADEEELATQKSFWLGRTNIQPGLGMLEANFEPQILNDNRWGRFYSLAFNHPDLVVFGLMNNTALQITDQGAVVVGQNAIFSLDLRFAALELGSNDGYVIANGLLDVFATGDPVRPDVADTLSDPQRAPTPDISASLETATVAAPSATLVPPTPAPSNTPQPSLPAVQSTAIPPQPTASGAPDGALVLLLGVLVVSAFGIIWLARRHNK